MFTNALIEIELHGSGGLPHARYLAPEVPVQHSGTPQDVAELLDVTGAR